MSTLAVVSVVRRELSADSELFWEEIELGRETRRYFEEDIVGGGIIERRPVRRTNG